MLDLSNNLPDKLFFLFCFVFMLIVAITPTGLLKLMSFGQSSMGDVSKSLVKIVQIIAAVSSVIAVVTFVVSFFVKI